MWRVYYNKHYNKSLSIGILRFCVFTCGQQTRTFDTINTNRAIMMGNPIGWTVYLPTKKPSFWVLPHSSTNTCLAGHAQLKCMRKFEERVSSLGFCSESGKTAHIHDYALEWQMRVHFISSVFIILVTIFNISDFEWPLM